MRKVIGLVLAAGRISAEQVVSTVEHQGGAQPLADTYDGFEDPAGVTASPAQMSGGRRLSEAGEQCDTTGSVQWQLADLDQSCEDKCGAGFCVSTARAEGEACGLAIALSLNVTCSDRSQTYAGASPHAGRRAPFYDQQNDRCRFQNLSYGFSCTGSAQQQMRFCPCAGASASPSSPPALPPPPLSPPGASYTNGYQRFDTLMNQSEAEADCVSRGMRLATVRSAADNARLVTVAFGGGNTAGPFFGANDIAVEGEWRESSDPSSPLVSYTNWNDASHGGNEPNDSGDGEDCVQVRTDGLWNDVRCTSTLPYICEVDAYRWDSDGAALSDTYSTFADGQGSGGTGQPAICVGKPWPGYPKWHDCNVASEYHQVCMPTTAGGGEAGLVVNPNECDRDYS